MRIAWLPLLLALAAPASGSQQTESIPLRYLSPVEAERILLSPGDLRPPRGGSLLSREIVAITTDPRAQALVVTGSPQAIRDLKQMVRLLDIPARRLRVCVRLLQLDAAAIRDLKLPLSTIGETGESGISVHVNGLDEQQVRDIVGRARGVVAEVDVPGANNRPVRVFSPGAASEQPAHFLIVPRVNGDGTITVSVTSGAAKSDARVRAASGKSLLFVPAAGPALLVTSTLLPEPAENDPGK